MAAIEEIDIWYHYIFEDMSTKTCCESCYHRHLKGAPSYEQDDFFDGKEVVSKKVTTGERKGCFFCREDVDVVIVNHLDFEEGQG